MKKKEHKWMGRFKDPTESRKGGGNGKKEGRERKERDRNVIPPETPAACPVGSAGIAACAGAAIGGAALFYHFENNTIATTEVTYRSSRVPEGFDGCRILQVSDLHNKMFGKHQRKLIRKMLELEPDVIFLTGDLIYKRNPDIGAALEFVEQAAALVPVYFVTGNHEQWSGCYEEMGPRLEAAGAVVLNNESTAMFRGDDAVTLIGLQDIDFISYGGEADGGVMPQERTARLNKGLPRYSAAQKDAFERQLHELCRKADLEWPSVAGDSALTSNSFKILLSHKPEFAEIYARQGVDLTFCGHAHGGQVRLPLIGGLYAPGQGVLPKYTSGLYDLSGQAPDQGVGEAAAQSAMVVSRGLGDSIIPMRVFNRPELMVVTLRSDRI